MSKKQVLKMNSNPNKGFEGWNDILQSYVPIVQQQLKHHDLLSTRGQALFWGIFQSYHVQMLTPSIIPGTTLCIVNPEGKPTGIASKG